MLNNQLDFHREKITKEISLTFFVLIAFLVFSNCLTAQSIEIETLDNPTVDFILKTPKIDGQLDTNLEYLNVRKFKHIWQFDNPVTDTAQVTYRMAYTPSHLYLYIETGIDSISYHRRGYLWGDGYKILLGIPQEDSLTNEYYELAYSPSLDKNHWERQRIISYNFSQIRKKLSKSSVSQEIAVNGISGFEALIAWNDINPYHPWFLDKMGYNIYFAKGIESKEYGYITNGYSLVEDEGIWDEEIPRRNYNSISFEKPNSVLNPVILAQPKRNNLQVGEALTIELRSIGTKPSKSNLKLSLSDLNSKLILSKKIDFQLDKNLTKEAFIIDIEDLKPGSYKLIVQNLKDTTLNAPLTILPTIDFQDISETIQENKDRLEIGTVNTLQFELNQIAGKLTDLKAYETGTSILDDWKLFLTKYALFTKGTDPYKDLHEPYRRAFKSKYDNSYQPYSIKLPKNYDPSKKYPLLVFLHGSGSDEQGLLNRARSGGNFIEIAPLARDIFRAYSGDESQKDIIEAIDDVSKYFSVNKDKIIIGGFSMGGYGALRTFYERPKLYKGIAVFAGHPNLANEWLEGEHPNFLDNKYLSSFSDIPVFIYHGRKDAALDVDLIEIMSKRLTAAGAIVTKSIVEELGHEYPDTTTNKQYFDWLNNTTNK